MKAIIDLAPRGSVFDTAKTQLARGGNADLRLHFESAKTLFSHLTPSRIALLETLRAIGPCSIYALARAAERNYSNVHADVAALEELGLVTRTAEDAVQVPFDAVEIRVTLREAA